MANVISYVKKYFSIDRLLVGVGIIILIVLLISHQESLVKFIVIVSTLLIGLCVRLVVSRLHDKNLKATPPPERAKKAVEMLSELAVQMKVVLNPSKPATFEADFTNASAGPRPYFSGLKPHYGGSVRIGYLILYGLQDSALRCVLAHELAHIKKKHSIVLGILVLVLIGGVVVSAMYSGNIILFLLVILVGAVIISVLSWYDEYQADSVAAKVVGSTEMASALRQVSALLNRGKDSFTHPSFEKRISSLTGSDKD